MLLLVSGVIDSLIRVSVTATMEQYLQVFYAGIDHSIEGNGGPSCTGYLSTVRRIVETIVASSMAVGWLWWANSRRVVPTPPKKGLEDLLIKRILLVVLCLVLGVEIGYKLSTKTLIYMLNPCHMISMMQIYLLSAPPSHLVTTIFRFNIHCLYGPILALVFPILNTRSLPFEAENYYIQHVLILVVPVYLLSVGGTYTIERISDWSWASTMIALQFFYHFIGLQGLGMLSEANLNNMVCPAVSDPFAGVHYRVVAIVHQTLLIGLTGKVYTIFWTTVLKTLGHRGNFFHPDEVRMANKRTDCSKITEGKQSNLPVEHVSSTTLQGAAAAAAAGGGGGGGTVMSTFWSYLGNWCSLQAWREETGLTSNGHVRTLSSSNGHVEHTD